VGGRNATPIVNAPDRDEGAPAFSPDGSLIAFHESGRTGGIFVVGATGESERRLTDMGFDPAWSPDGKQIVFATEEIVDPTSRQGNSGLNLVDVSGGSPRKLLEVDGVQPAWSPSGERIVYWNNYGGQRDIYTISAGGGTPTAITRDAAVDWSPVWSADGRYVYFASDRGGVMNLWRIAVDQSSGGVLGSPEPVTAGVQASAALPRFSRDGSRLAFRSRIASVNPVAIPFDPSTLQAGTPVLVDTQNNIRIPSGVSSDGRQLVYFSIGEPQEDIFIGSVTGPMRRLTDDSARDRGPVFTPDGRSVVFYSNRDGEWAIWTMRTDGSGLRQVAALKGGLLYPMISPKGDTVVSMAASARGVFSMPLVSTPSTVTELPGTQINDKYLEPTGWSPDGTRITGPLMPYSGRPTGVGVYDVAAHTTTELSDDEAYAVKWLADNRHVIYFTKKGYELVVLDSVTRERRVIDVHLPGPSRDELFAISPDTRTIYYGAVRSEADIWIVERK
jgi:Tol biopolymer transport system component